MRFAADNKTLAKRGIRFPTLSGRVHALIVALALSVGAVSVADAATYTVTKTADTNDGNCDADCSLREAVIAANSNLNSPVVDTITVPAGTYTLTVDLHPKVTRDLH